VVALGSAIKQYYHAGGQMIAERVLANGANTLYYLAGDHLGNTSVTTCGSGCGTAGSPSPSASAPSALSPGAR